MADYPNRRQPKSPEYKLSCFDKSNEQRCNDIGAGWIEPDGSITLKINPGCAVAYNQDFVYKLWKQEQRQQPAPPKPKLHRGSGFDDMDDDIPF